MLAFSIPLFHSHTLALVSIPFFSGLTGYVINWTGVWMLFQPIEFKGFHVKGLHRLVRRLPAKMQNVPGLKHGGVGWQGIIPSRAGKMGSIAVDKQIAKIGGVEEFFGKLDPGRVAEHILTSSQEDIHELVDEMMEREYPELWHELPQSARETLHARVEAELPGVVHEVTDSIAENIEQLLDVKLMVVRLVEERRELTNRLFHEVGEQEFRMIIRFGFVFGFLFGLPAVPLVALLPEWWLLPLCGSFIGYATNWVGIWMIYEPSEPRRIGPFRFHGLFLRRQQEAAAAYGEIIAEDIITMRNIANELLHGPRSDRTRRLIEDAMRPAVDRAAGAAGTALRVAVGAEPYESLKDAVAVEAAEYTLGPLEDPEFNRRQNRELRELFTERMRELSYADFSDAMRSATDEDEWMLVAHGAIFGIAGGLLHYLVFGV